MKKLYTLIFLTFILFILVAFNYNKPSQTAHKADASNLETYQYIVTKIDSQGIYGKSTNDNTGIFLVKENIKGINLHVNDKISVTFPNKDSYETITKVQKIN